MVSRKINTYVFFGIVFILSSGFISFSYKYHFGINQVWPNLKIEKVHNLPDDVFESSGLAISDSIIWTFNDSGGEPELYGFSLSDTLMHNRVTLWNGYNFDWEDITQDPNYLYIGDIGNNFGNRQNLCIYRIKKKNLAKHRTFIAKGEKIEYTYPGYKSVSILSFTKSAFDCEAMIYSNDSIYLFTKDWVSQNTTIYSIPSKPGNYIAHKLREFNCNGLITAADYKGQLLILLGYKDYKPFLWKFGSLQRLINGTEKGKRIELPILANFQTEGIAIINDSTLLISAEGGSRSSAKLWELYLPKY